MKQNNMRWAGAIPPEGRSGDGAARAPESESVRIESTEGAGEE